MDADEVDMVIRFVSGNWPNPALSVDEVDVWMKALLPLTFDGAAETVDLIATSGAQFRPTAGQVVAEYRRQAGRKTDILRPQLEPYHGRAECGHSMNAVACPESVVHWVGVIRKQLEEAKGPMVKDWRKVVS